MSGAAQAHETTPIGRGWRKGLTGLVKARGTDWWTPTPETPLNAAVFYVAQIVEDALSLTERLVLRYITTPENRLKNDAGDRGILCDPGGYTRIAKAIGVCRKTVYNAIRSLKAKNALREFRVVMKGQQREKTIYYATHFGDLLPMWREDPGLFKTAATPARVVVFGRRKQLVTVELAAAHAMNPQRAPLRGCGQGRSEFAQRQAPTPPPAPEPLPSDEDIQTVRTEFLKWSPSNMKDWIDLLRAARRHAPAIPAHIVTAHIAQAVRTYKPTPQFPQPTPKWVIDQVESLAIQWAEFAAAGFKVRYLGEDLGTFATEVEADAAVSEAQRRRNTG